MRRLIVPFVLSFILGLSLSSQVSCAKAPPTLSPQGVSDWNTLQIGHDLDLIRDIVDSGTKTTPPIFQRDVNVKVATWHKAAVTTLAERSAGWRATIQTGLDQLFAALPVDVRNRLEPYKLLIKTVLAATS